MNNTIPRIIMVITFIFIITQFDVVAQISGTQHWKSKDILGAVGLVTALKDSTEIWYPFGTGVLVDVDSTIPHLFFITNRHIYIARDTFQIRLNNYIIKGEQTFYEPKFLNISKNTAALIPKTADSDFVAILVNRPKLGELNPIKINDFKFTSSLEYGEDVNFMGFRCILHLG